MDASIKALGACLLADSKPVYFSSKALTDSQQGCVVIRLEALAVSWAIEKFHHFLFASDFLLETDQKLLEAILSKVSIKLHQHCREYSLEHLPIISQ